MNVLQIIRRRPDFARAVLAMFLVAWLQAAILPCAVAADPPEGRASASGPSADTHGAAVEALADCIHCPAVVLENAHDCVSQDVSGQCADVDVGPDGRSAAQAQLEKLSAHAALLDSGAFGLLRVLRTPVAESKNTSSLALPSRPINLQNCVQLR